ncbi:hypothetical protein [Oceanobacillus alkalisoli]|uniref:hypothetical protein n=1 Tax=Oceanobacillus alkalisoli TaxID=2925113 RepID=UPI001EF0D489|nr:hypothetical protein [Oceanobacillus alkalisoli]MCF3943372.1 hypothetical protein [Oceanobacillus alkalisoli]MCG5103961.1 hypothetical protein [Oceanobacillus alkalisoli]
MGAWLALTKKEFRLGFPVFITALILYAGMMVGAYFLGKQIDHEEALILMAFMFVMGVHILFLVFYLHYTLSSERKRLHLWLHTPMSIAGLLLSKLFTGIVFMAVTFVVTLSASSLFFNQNIDFFNEQTIYNIMGLSTAVVFNGAIWLAVTFIFFWSIFLTFSQQMNDFLSFILTFMLFLITGWVYGLITSMGFVETITTWGPIRVDDIIVGFEFGYMDNAFEANTLSEASIFYIGHFIRDLIVSIIMFFAACWMIDRKVEV